jgi:hypothetical protein
MKLHLNDQAKQLATQLAEEIYRSKGLCLQAGEKLWLNKPATNAIVAYWGTCKDAKTVYALNKLLEFMCRKHLENCFNGNSEQHPEQEN